MTAEKRDSHDQKKILKPAQEAYNQLNSGRPLTGSKLIVCSLSFGFFGIFFGIFTKGSEGLMNKIK